MKPDPQQDAYTEKIGTVIDRRYRITGLLGRGGMGSVYRAEHVRIRRPVAVKLLHPGYGQVEEIARRFEREAFATGRIDHPNIVIVSDFGELDDGTLYLVMELLNGVSLGDIMVDEKQLAPRRALRIIKHVLRGLGHAHASEIIHRDIKPENVLLVEHAGEQEFAKILDFGIAKLVGEAEAEEGGEKLTQAGVAFGTPAYISPEQATGSNIDHRADIYSLSVMLYEMLIGRAPFVADDKMKLLAMHVTKPVPPFDQVAPELGLSPALERLIGRGLEKDPADRYQSTAEYISAIDQYLARSESPLAATPLGGEPTPAPNPGHTGAVGTVRSASTVHTGMSALTPKRRMWLYGGLGLAGFSLFVAIIANAARSKSDPDELPALMRKLENGESCAARARVIEEIRQLGDPRAVPGLNKARVRKDNECLGKDARKAIEELEKKRREATP